MVGPWVGGWTAPARCSLRRCGRWTPLARDGAPYTKICDPSFTSGVLKLFRKSGLPFLPQATELAEYTAKIALLEEARRRKENEVEEWQLRVSAGRQRGGAGGSARTPPSGLGRPIGN